MRDMIIFFCQREFNDFLQVSVSRQTIASNYFQFRIYGNFEISNLEILNFL